MLPYDVCRSESHVLGADIVAAAKDMLPAIQDITAKLNDVLIQPLFIPSPFYGLPDEEVWFTSVSLTSVRSVVVPGMASTLHAVLFDTAMWYLSLPWGNFVDTGVLLLQQRCVCVGFERQPACVKGSL